MSDYESYSCACGRKHDVGIICCIRDQVQGAARILRISSKRKLITELLEAHQSISENSRIILKLETALRTIVESEAEQSIRSYGLGDIARDALQILDDARNAGGNSK